MVTSIQKRLAERAEGESGFTLVELLVVMIIIAILMAVAVPIFLSQKNKAVSTGTKSDIKNISDWFDSCAASATDGSYTNCVLANANGKDSIQTDEPGLYTGLTTEGVASFGGDPGPGALAASSSGLSPAVGKAAVDVGANSFEISESTRTISAGGEDGFAIFTLKKDSAGTQQVCNSATTTVKSQLCPSGTW